MQPAQDSWERPFNGSALDVLLEALDNLAVAGTEPSFSIKEPLPIYARVLTCVQSSGTGKSRLFHEAALKVFTLPVCWRTEHSTGYPVRDASVCELFEKRASLSPKSPEPFWQAFLTALLLETAKCIDIGKLTSEPEQWRTFFNQGMTSRNHNRNRLAFFRAVTETTKACLVCQPSSFFVLLHSHYDVYVQRLSFNTAHSTLLTGTRSYIDFAMEKGTTPVRLLASILNRSLRALRLSPVNASSTSSLTKPTLLSTSRGKQNHLPLLLFSATQLDSSASALSHLAC